MRTICKYSNTPNIKAILNQRVIYEKDMDVLNERLSDRHVRLIERAEKELATKPVEKLYRVNFYIDEKYLDRPDEVVVDLETFSFRKLIFNDIIKERDRPEYMIPAYLILVVVVWGLIKYRHKKKLGKMEGHRQYVKENYPSENIAVTTARKELEYFHSDTLDLLRSADK